MDRVTDRQTEKPIIPCQLFNKAMTKSGSTNTQLWSLFMVLNCFLKFICTEVPGKYDSWNFQYCYCKSVFKRHQHHLSIISYECFYIDICHAKIDQFLAFEFYSKSLLSLYFPGKHRSDFCQYYQIDIFLHILYSYISLYLSSISFFNCGLIFRQGPVSSTNAVKLSLTS